MGNGGDKEDQRVSEENRKLNGVDSFVIVSNRKARVDASSFAAEPATNGLDNTR